MTDKERQIYKKRIIIENRFSWLDYLRTVVLIGGKAHKADNTYMSYA